MQGLAVPVVLQDKDTWTFRIIRIVFNRHRRAHAVDNVSDKEIVCGELIVPVRRNTHLTACYQGSYLLQRLAQLRDPFLFLDQY